ncbi:hypothetical protein ACFQ2B_25785 [Streptomyces stramineus]
MGRTPAEVTYRWVTGSGKVADGGWKSVRFTDARTRTVRHTESGRGASDGGKDWIAVEIKSPQRVTSSQLAFTVECRTTAPGGSPSRVPRALPGSPPRARAVRPAPRLRRDRATPAGSTAAPAAERPGNCDPFRLGQAAEAKAGR